MRKTFVHDRLAEELRTARERAGLTQRSMAARLGTNQTQVSMIESGTQQVHVVELVEWCRILGSNPVDVLRRITEAPDSED